MPSATTSANASHNEVLRILALHPSQQNAYVVLSLPRELFLPSTDRSLRLRETRRAYKAKSLQIHPDRCTHPGATEAFRIVHRAYEDVVLRGWVDDRPASPIFGMGMGTPVRKERHMTPEERVKEMGDWMTKAHDKYFRGRRRAASDVPTKGHGASTTYEEMVHEFMEAMDDETEDDPETVEWLRKMHARGNWRRGAPNTGSTANDDHSPENLTSESESEEKSDADLPPWLQNIYARKPRQYAAARNFSSANNQPEPSESETDQIRSGEEELDVGSSDTLHHGAIPFSLSSAYGAARFTYADASAPAHFAATSSDELTEEEETVDRTNDHNRSGGISSSSPSEDEDTPEWVHAIHQADRRLRRGGGWMSSSRGGSSRGSASHTPTKSKPSPFSARPLDQLKSDQNVKLGSSSMDHLPQSFRAPSSATSKSQSHLHAPKETDLPGFPNKQVPASPLSRGRSFSEPVTSPIDKRRGVARMRRSRYRLMEIDADASDSGNESEDAGDY